MYGYSVRILIHAAVLVIWHGQIAQAVDGLTASRMPDACWIALSELMAARNSLTPNQIRTALSELPLSNEIRGAASVALLLNHDGRAIFFDNTALLLNEARAQGHSLNQFQLRELVVRALESSPLPTSLFGERNIDSPFVRSLAEAITRLTRFDRTRPVSAMSVVTEIQRAQRVIQDSLHDEISRLKRAQNESVSTLTGFRPLPHTLQESAEEILTRSLDPERARAILSLASHARSAPAGAPRLTLMNHQDTTFNGTVHQEVVTVPGVFNLGAHGAPGILGVRLGTEGFNAFGDARFTILNPSDVAAVLLANPVFRNSNAIFLNACNSAADPNPEASISRIRPDERFSVAEGVARFTGRIALGLNGIVHAYTDSSGKSYMWVEDNAGNVLSRHQALSLFRPVNEGERRVVRRESVPNPGIYFTNTHFVDQRPQGAPNN